MNWRTPAWFLFLLTWLSAGRLAAAEPAPQMPGWELGVAAWSFNRFTLLEAIDKTAALGLHRLEIFEGQRISTNSTEKLGTALSEEAANLIRQRLAATGVKLTSVYIHSLPPEEASCRQAFELCRRLGIAMIVSEPPPETLNVIEKLCDEEGVKVAIHNHAKGVSRYWDPHEVLRACEGRSPRLGVCADIGHWQRSGLDVVESVRLVGRRLFDLHLKDLDQTNTNGHDVVWGTGQGHIAEVLRAVSQLDINPPLFTVEYEYNWDHNSPEIAQCVKFFAQTVGEITASQPATSPLSAGWASADVTPQRPVALIGQLYKRVSKSVRDPLTATALGLETRGADGAKEQAILVSCDALWIQKVVQDKLRAALKDRLPDFDLRKLFLNATHTHTAPGFADSTFHGLYDTSDDPKVMKPSEYADFFVARVADAVIRAWQNRQPAGVSWALGDATIGLNRRVQYVNGTTALYGQTSRTNFAQLEGWQDPAVKVLCFWNTNRELTGLMLNVPCPAQEVENLYEISADYWSDVRQELRRRHGAGLFVLPQCAPAGDLSPHPVFRKDPELRMLERRGLSFRRELARRLANAVDELLPLAQADVRTQVVFRHTVANIDLPERQPPAAPFYETDSVKPIELHALRLGDVALASNPFELYVDYAVRIEARSRAIVTFLVQLSCQHGGYLPTERAVKGGGYSGDKFIVGPTGGQVLVEQTVQRINALFP